MNAFDICHNKIIFIILSSLNRKLKDQMENKKKNVEFYKKMLEILI